MPPTESTMPELRKDPIVGRWVIIAPDRMTRPQNIRDDVDGLCNCLFNRLNCSYHLRVLRIHQSHYFQRTEAVQIQTCGVTGLGG